MGEFNDNFQCTYFRDCSVEMEAPSFYELLGGEEGVRRLVDAFYRRMDAEPGFSTIRDMHQGDLATIHRKLFCFLSGWLGGPNLYVENYGQPFMRRRHLPFAIGIAERDQWLQCMAQAMAEIGLDADLQLKLGAAFYRLADFMRNSETSAG